MKIKDWVVMAIMIALTAVLDMFGVFTLPVGIVSVSSFYFASAFYLLFIETFKWKGIVSVYLGLLLASFFTTGFSVMPLILAWGNVVCNIFIVIIMKKCNNDYKFDSIKKIIIELLLFLIAPLISAFWVLGGYVLFGVIPVATLMVAVFAWWLGGIAVYIIIGTPMMRFILPLFKKFNF